MQGFFHYVISFFAAVIFDIIMPNRFNFYAHELHTDTDV